jgi:hypothetical protein
VPWTNAAEKHWRDYFSLLYVAVVVARCFNANTRGGVHTAMYFFIILAQGS